MMGNEILGYSERGIVNAFFFDLYYSARQSELMVEFLKAITLAGGESLHSAIGGDIESWRLYIEPSLSGFGDPDLVLMLKLGDASTVAIFIEAKINYNMDNHCDDFAKNLPNESKSITSTLIGQLFLKTRLCEELRERNPDSLKDFPVRFIESAFHLQGTSKDQRKLGKEPTVISKNGCAQGVRSASRHFFVIFDSDTESRLNQFFNLPELLVRMEKRCLGGGRAKPLSGSQLRTSYAEQAKSMFDCLSKHKSKFGWIGIGSIRLIAQKGGLTTALATLDWNMAEERGV